MTHVRDNNSNNNRFKTINMQYDGNKKFSAKYPLHKDCYPESIVQRRHIKREQVSNLPFWCGKPAPPEEPVCDCIGICKCVSAESVYSGPECMRPIRCRELIPLPELTPVESYEDSLETMEKSTSSDPSEIILYPLNISKSMALPERKPRCEFKDNKKPRQIVSADNVLLTLSLDDFVKTMPPPMLLLPPPYDPFVASGRFFSCDDLMEPNLEIMSELVSERI